MSWQLSTAATEVLDDGRQRRYCRIIFAGCCSQPPPHRPMWSTFGSAVSDHDSFPFLKPLPGCPFVRRHVREPGNRIGLRFGPRPGADPPIQHTSESSRCHGDTPVRCRCVGSRTQRAHLAAEERRHRRSEWAGVSWPNDDDREPDAADDTGLARVHKTTAATARTATRHCAHLFVSWRATPHASVSSWN